jgi:hypothetical protein
VRKRHPFRGWDGRDGMAMSRSSDEPRQARAAQPGDASSSFLQLFFEATRENGLSPGPSPNRGIHDDRSSD